MASYASFIDTASNSAQDGIAAWAENGLIHYALWDPEADAWGDAQAINNAAGGRNVTVTSGHLIRDPQSGLDIPAVLISWESGIDNEASLYGVIGSYTNNGELLFSDQLGLLPQGITVKDHSVGLEAGGDVLIAVNSQTVTNPVGADPTDLGPEAYQDSDINFYKLRLERNEAPTLQNRRTFSGSQYQGTLDNLLQSSTGESASTIGGVLVRAWVNGIEIPIGSDTTLQGIGTLSLSAEGLLTFDRGSNGLSELQISASLISNTANGRTNTHTSTLLVPTELITAADLPNPLGDDAPDITIAVSPLNPFGNPIATSRAPLAYQAVDRRERVTAQTFAPLRTQGANSYRTFSASGLLSSDNIANQDQINQNPGNQFGDDGYAGTGEAIGGIFSDSTLQTLLNGLYANPFELGPKYYLQHQFSLNRILGGFGQTTGTLGSLSTATETKQPWSSKYGPFDLQLATTLDYLRSAGTGTGNSTLTTRSTIKFYLEQKTTLTAEKKKKEQQRANILRKIREDQNDQEAAVSFAAELKRIKAKAEEKIRVNIDQYLSEEAKNKRKNKLSLLANELDAAKKAATREKEITVALEDLLKLSYTTAKLEIESNQLREQGDYRAAAKLRREVRNLETATKRAQSLIETEYGIAFKQFDSDGDELFMDNYERTIAIFEAYKKHEELQQVATNFAKNIEEYRTSYDTLSLRRLRARNALIISDAIKESKNLDSVESIYTTSDIRVRLLGAQKNPIVTKPSFPNSRTQGAIDNAVRDLYRSSFYTKNEADRAKGLAKFNKWDLISIDYQTNKIEFENLFSRPEDGSGSKFERLGLDVTFGNLFNVPGLSRLGIYGTGSRTYQYQNRASLGIQPLSLQKTYSELGFLAQFSAGASADLGSIAPAMPGASLLSADLELTAGLNLGGFWTYNYGNTPLAIDPNSQLDSPLAFSTFDNGAVNSKSAEIAFYKNSAPGLQQTFRIANLIGQYGNIIAGLGTKFSARDGASQASRNFANRLSSLSELASAIGNVPLLVGAAENLWYSPRSGDAYNNADIGGGNGIGVLLNTSARASVGALFGAVSGYGKASIGIKGQFAFNPFGVSIAAPYNLEVGYSLGTVSKVLYSERGDLPIRNGDDYNSSNQNLFAADQLITQLRAATAALNPSDPLLAANSTDLSGHQLVTLQADQVDYQTQSALQQALTESQASASGLALSSNGVLTIPLLPPDLTEQERSQLLDDNGHLRSFYLSLSSDSSDLSLFLDTRNLIPAGSDAESFQPQLVPLADGLRAITLNPVESTASGSAASDRVSVNLAALYQLKPGSSLPFQIDQSLIASQGDPAELTLPTLTLRYSTTTPAAGSAPAAADFLVPPTGMLASTDTAAPLLRDELGSDYRLGDATSSTINQATPTVAPYPTAFVVTDGGGSITTSTEDFLLSAPSSDGSSTVTVRGRLLNTNSTPSGAIDSVVLYTTAESNAWATPAFATLELADFTARSASGSDATLSLTTDADGTITAIAIPKGQAGSGYFLGDSGAFTVAITPDGTPATSASSAYALIRVGVTDGIVTAATPLFQQQVGSFGANHSPDSTSSELRIQVPNQIGGLGSGLTLNLLTRNSLDRNYVDETDVNIGGHQSQFINGQYTSDAILSYTQGGPTDKDTIQSLTTTDNLGLNLPLKVHNYIQNSGWRNISFVDPQDVYTPGVDGYSFDSASANLFFSDQQQTSALLFSNANTHFITDTRDLYLLPEALKDSSIYFSYRQSDSNNNWTLSTPQLLSDPSMGGSNSSGILQPFFAIQDAGVAPYYGKNNQLLAAWVHTPEGGSNAEIHVRIGHVATGNAADGVSWGEISAIPVTNGINAENLTADAITNLSLTYISDQPVLSWSLRTQRPFQAAALDQQPDTYYRLDDLPSQGTIANIAPDALIADGVIISGNELSSVSSSWLGQLSSVPIDSAAGALQRPFDAEDPKPDQTGDLNPGLAFLGGEYALLPGRSTDALLDPSRDPATGFSAILYVNPDAASTSAGDASSTDASAAPQIASILDSGLFNPDAALPTAEQLSLPIQLRRVAATEAVARLDDAGNPLTDDAGNLLTDTVNGYRYTVYLPANSFADIDAAGIGSELSPFNLSFLAEETSLSFEKAASGDQAALSKTVELNTTFLDSILSYSLNTAARLASLSTDNDEAILTTFFEADAASPGDPATNTDSTDDKTTAELIEFDSKPNLAITTLQLPGWSLRQRIESNGDQFVEFNWGVDANGDPLTLSAAITPEQWSQVAISYGPDSSFDPVEITTTDGNGETSSRSVFPAAARLWINGELQAQAIDDPQAPAVFSFLATDHQLGYGFSGSLDELILNDNPLTTPARTFSDLELSRYVNPNSATEATFQSTGSFHTTDQQWVWDEAETFRKIDYIPSTIPSAINPGPVDAAAAGDSTALRPDGKADFTATIALNNLAPASSIRGLRLTLSNGETFSLGAGRLVQRDATGNTVVIPEDERGSVLALLADNTLLNQGSSGTDLDYTVLNNTANLQLFVPVAHATDGDILTATSLDLYISSPSQQATGSDVMAVRQLISPTNTVAFTSTTTTDTSAILSSYYNRNRIEATITRALPRSLMEIGNGFQALLANAVEPSLPDTAPADDPNAPAPLPQTYAESIAHGRLNGLDLLAIANPSLPGIGGNGTNRGVLWLLPVGDQSDPAKSDQIEQKLQQLDDFIAAPGAALNSADLPGLIIEGRDLQSIGSSVLFADLTGDGIPELIIGASQAQNSDGSNIHGALILIEGSYLQTRLDNKQWRLNLSDLNNPDSTLADHVRVIEGASSSELGAALAFGSIGSGGTNALAIGAPGFYAPVNKAVEGYAAYDPNGPDGNGYSVGAVYTIAVGNPDLFRQEVSDQDILDVSAPLITGALEHLANVNYGAEVTPRRFGQTLAITSKQGDFTGDQTADLAIGIPGLITQTQLLAGINPKLVDSEGRINAEAIQPVIDQAITLPPGLQVPAGEDGVLNLRDDNTLDDPEEANTGGVLLLAGGLASSSSADQAKKVLLIGDTRFGGDAAAGSALATGASLTGNSIDDLAIALPSISWSNGQVNLIDGDTIRSWFDQATATNYGIADLISTEKDIKGTVLQAGTIRSATLDATLSITGGAETQQYGSALSLGGDINGDGSADLVIGDRFFDNQSGRVNVIFGAPDLATIAPDAESFTAIGTTATSGSTSYAINLDVPDVERVLTFHSAAQGQQLGTSLLTANLHTPNSAFDSQIDPLADLILPTSSAGSTLNVVAGKPFLNQIGGFNLQDLGGASGYEVARPNNPEEANSGFAFLGDINGDGLSDALNRLVTSAPAFGISYGGNSQANPNQSDAGTGGSGGLNLANQFGVQLGGSTDARITSVHRAGDLNADGIGDLILNTESTPSYALQLNADGVLSLTGPGNTLLWSAEQHTTLIEPGYQFGFSANGNTASGFALQLSDQSNAFLQLIDQANGSPTWEPQLTFQSLSTNHRNPVLSVQADGNVTLSVTSTRRQGFLTVDETYTAWALGDSNNPTASGDLDNTLPRNYSYLLALEPDGTLRRSAYTTGADGTIELLDDSDATYPLNQVIHQGAPGNSSSGRTRYILPGESLALSGSQSTRILPTNPPIQLSTPAGGILWSPDQPIAAGTIRRLTMEENGNLVAYNTNNEAIWSLDPLGTGATTDSSYLLVLEPNGTLRRSAYTTGTDGSIELLDDSAAHPLNQTLYTAPLGADEVGISQYLLPTESIFFSADQANSANAALITQTPETTASPLIADQVLLKSDGTLALVSDNQPTRYLAANNSFQLTPQANTAATDLLLVLEPNGTLKLSAFSTAADGTPELITGDPRNQVLYQAPATNPVLGQRQLLLPGSSLSRAGNSSDLPSALTVQGTTVASSHVLLGGDLLSNNAFSQYAVPETFQTRSTATNSALNRLLADQALNPGEALQSPNGLFTASMQPGGNFLIAQTASATDAAPILPEILVSLAALRDANGEPFAVDITDAQRQLGSTPATNLLASASGIAFANREFLTPELTQLVPFTADTSSLIQLTPSEQLSSPDSPFRYLQLNNAGQLEGINAAGEVLYTFGVAQDTPEASSTNPSTSNPLIASAATGNGGLLQVQKASDSTTLQWRYSEQPDQINQQAWSNLTINGSGMTSDQAPRLAILNDTVYLAFLGTDESGQINIASFDQNDDTWNNLIQLDGEAGDKSYGLDLLSENNQLKVFFFDFNGSGLIRTATSKTPTDVNSWSPSQRLTYGELKNDTPSTTLTPLTSSLPSAAAAISGFSLARTADGGLVNVVANTDNLALDIGSLFSSWVEQRLSQTPDLSTDDRAGIENFAATLADQLTPLENLSTNPDATSYDNLLALAQYLDDEISTGTGASFRNFVAGKHPIFRHDPITLLDATNQTVIDPSAYAARLIDRNGDGHQELLLTPADASNTDRKPLLFDLRQLSSDGLLTLSEPLTAPQTTAFSWKATQPLPQTANLDGNASIRDSINQSYGQTNAGYGDQPLLHLTSPTDPRTNQWGSWSTVVGDADLLDFIKGNHAFELKIPAAYFQAKTPPGGDPDFQGADATWFHLGSKQFHNSAPNGSALDGLAIQVNEWHDSFQIWWNGSKVFDTTNFTVRQIADLPSREDYNGKGYAMSKASQTASAADMWNANIMTYGLYLRFQPDSSSDGGKLLVNAGSASRYIAETGGINDARPNILNKGSAHEVAVDRPIQIQVDQQLSLEALAWSGAAPGMHALAAIEFNTDLPISGPAGLDLSALQNVGDLNGDGLDDMVGLGQLSSGYNWQYRSKNNSYSYLDLASNNLKVPGTINPNKTPETTTGLKDFYNFTGLAEVFERTLLPPGANGENIQQVHLNSPYIVWGNSSGTVDYTDISPIILGSTQSFLDYQKGTDQGSLEHYANFSSLENIQIKGSSDYNADGFDDLLITDTGLDAASGGTTFILYGNRDLAEATSYNNWFGSFFGIAGTQNDIFQWRDAAPEGAFNATSDAFMREGEKFLYAKLQPSTSGLGFSAAIDPNGALDAAYSASFKGINLSLAPEGVHIDTFFGVPGYSIDGIDGSGNTNDFNGDGIADLYINTEANPGANLATESAYILYGNQDLVIPGATEILGTPYSDSLKGTVVNDNIFGFAGDDILQGLGGLDVLNSGPGNDLIYVTGDQFRSVNGGTGTDALALRGSLDQSWDFTALANRIHNIESVSLEHYGANNLTLNAAALAAITSSEGTLFVDGDQHPLTPAQTILKRLQERRTDAALTAEQQALIATTSASYAALSAGVISDTSLLQDLSQSLQLQQLDQALYVLQFPDQPTPLSVVESQLNSINAALAEDFSSFTSNTLFLTPDALLNAYSSWFSDRLTASATSTSATASELEQIFLEDATQEQLNALVSEFPTLFPAYFPADDTANTDNTTDTNAEPPLTVQARSFIDLSLLVENRSIEALIQQWITSLREQDSEQPGSLSADQQALLAADLSATTDAMAFLEELRSSMAAAVASRYDRVTLSSEFSLADIQYLDDSSWISIYSAASGQTLKAPGWISVSIDPYLTTTLTPTDPTRPQASSNAADTTAPEPPLLGSTPTLDAAETLLSSAPGVSIAVSTPTVNRDASAITYTLTRSGDTTAATRLHARTVGATADLVPVFQAEVVFQPGVISQEIAIPLNPQSDREQQSSTWLQQNLQESVQLDVTLLPQQASGPRSSTAHALSVYEGTAAFITDDTTPLDPAQLPADAHQTLALFNTDPLEITAHTLDLDADGVADAPVHISLLAPEGSHRASTALIQSSDGNHWITLEDADQASGDLTLTLETELPQALRERGDRIVSFTPVDGGLYDLDQSVNGEISLAVLPAITAEAAAAAVSKPLLLIPGLPGDPASTFSTLHSPLPNGTSALWIRVPNPHQSLADLLTQLSDDHILAHGSQTTLNAQPTDLVGVLLLSEINTEQFLALNSKQRLQGLQASNDWRIHIPEALSDSGVFSALNGYSSFQLVPLDRDHTPFAQSSPILGTTDSDQWLLPGDATHLTFSSQLLITGEANDQIGSPVTSQTTDAAVLGSNLVLSGQGSDTLLPSQHDLAFSGSGDDSFILQAIGTRTESASGNDSITIHAQEQLILSGDGDDTITNATPPIADRDANTTSIAAIIQTGRGSDRIALNTADHTLPAAPLLITDFDLNSDRFILHHFTLSDLSFSTTSTETGIQTTLSIYTDNQGTVELAQINNLSIDELNQPYLFLTDQDPASTALNLNNNGSTSSSVPSADDNSLNVLHADHLISTGAQGLLAFAKRAFTADDTGTPTLRVYIHNQEGTTAIAAANSATDNKAITTKAFSSQQLTHLQNALSTLTNNLNLNLSYTTNPAESNLDIYYDAAITSSASQTIHAIVLNNDNGSSQWSELILSAASLEGDDALFAFTSKHELGHIVGLEHPFDSSDGDSHGTATSGATTSDTVMAYRTGEQQSAWPESYTALDWRALIMAWDLNPSINQWIFSDPSNPATTQIVDTQTAQTLLADPNGPTFLGADPDALSNSTQTQPDLQNNTQNLPTDDTSSNNTDPTSTTNSDEESTAHNALNKSALNLSSSDTQSLASQPTPDSSNSSGLELTWSSDWSGFDLSASTAILSSGTPQFIAFSDPNSTEPLTLSRLDGVSLAADAADNTLIAASHTTIDAAAGDDTLISSSGTENTLFAGPGSDLILSSSQGDTLYGGIRLGVAPADGTPQSRVDGDSNRFIIDLDAASNPLDLNITIADFQIGFDSIFLLSGNPQTAPLNITPQNYANIQQQLLSDYNLKLNAAPTLRATAQTPWILQSKPSTLVFSIDQIANDLDLGNTLTFQLNGNPDWISLSADQRHLTIDLPQGITPKEFYAFSQRLINKEFKIDISDTHTQTSWIPNLLYAADSDSQLILELQEARTLLTPEQVKQLLDQNLQVPELITTATNTGDQPEALILSATPPAQTLPATALGTNNLPSAQGYAQITLDPTTNTLQNDGYDPITGLGTRFATLDLSAPNTMSALTGTLNPGQSQTGFSSATPNFSPILAIDSSNNHVLTIGDGNTTNTSAAFVSITLPVQTENIHQIGYIAFNPDETITLDDATIIQRARILGSNLKANNNAPTESINLNATLQVRNNQKLVFFSVQGSTLAALNNQPTNSPLFSFLDLNHTSASLTAANQHTGLSLDISLGGTPDLTQVLRSSSTNSPYLDFSALRGFSLEGAINTTRGADYESRVGFYRIESHNGSILSAAGDLLGTDHPEYATEALRQSNLLFSGQTFSSANQSTSTADVTPFVAEGLWAPYAIVNTGQTTQTYFGYANANPDNIGHFQSIGASSIGLEDILGGGDLDFNDNITTTRFHLAT